MIRNILHYLKRTNERNYIMFLIGIYTGLRIGDILKLRVIDIKHKRSFKMKMQKTKDEITININPELKKALDLYCENRDPIEYLIKSNEGYNKPIDRTQAYRIIRAVSELFGLNNIGCHTLRKTFGYHYYYASGKDIVAVQRALGHKDPSVTLRYIGILQDDINKGINRLKY